MIYFCSAAETENFAKAAQEHNVPPASISHSIKRLETELGVSLFDRSANGVQLNERGKALYQGAKASLAILEDARKKATDENMDGSVRLLVESGRKIVHRGVQVFQSRNKNVSFHIEHTPDDDWDKYDLIVTDNFPYQKRKYFKSHGLLKDDMVLAMHVDHPLAKKESILLQDLEHQPLITTSSGSVLCVLTEKICNDAHFEPNIAIQSDDPYYINQYLKMGMGIAILPSLSWEGLPSEEVCFRRIDDIFPKRAKKATLVCYKTHKYMARHTKRFLDVLLEVAKEYAQ